MNDLPESIYVYSKPHTSTFTITLLISYSCYLIDDHRFPRILSSSIIEDRNRIVCQLLPLPPSHKGCNLTEMKNPAPLSFHHGITNNLVLTHLLTLPPTPFQQFLCTSKVTETSCIPARLTAGTTLYYSHNYLIIQKQNSHSGWNNC